MRYALASFCLLIALGIQIANAAGPYATGLSAPSKEQLSWGAKNVRLISTRQTNALLPAACKNITYLPVVNSQGGYGSCASWASTYYLKTYQEAKEHGWVRPDPAKAKSRVANPLFCYSVQSAGVDSGSSILGNLQFMTRHGAATYYHRNDAQGLTLPTEAEWRAAASWRSQSAASISLNNTPEGLAALKERIASGDLAVIANLMTNNLVFTYPNDGPGISNAVYYAPASGTYDPGNGMSALHALTIVGYDDARSYFDGSGTTKQGAFLIVNSWGKSWGWTDPDAGSGGFAWLAYEVVKGLDCAYVMDDRIGYVPKQFAVVEFSHPMLQELDLLIRGGDRGSERFEYSVMDDIPRARSRPVFNFRLALDLTDEPDFLKCNSYSMGIKDIAMPGWDISTGWIYHFAIDRSDCPQSWVSADCSADKPIETADSAWSAPITQYARVGLLEDEGTIVDVPTMITKGSHDWGDYDGDGDLDLVFSTGSSAGSTAAIMRNDGADGFRPSGISIANLCGQVIWADLNKDNRLDLVMCGWKNSWDNPNEVHLYLNQGAGLFIETTNAIPTGASAVITLGDYDADGDLDIGWCDGAYNYPAYATRNVIQLWKNDSWGGFSDSGIRLGSGTRGVRYAAWGDFTGDGLQDIAVAGTFESGGVESKEIRLYRNQGNGGFAVATSLLISTPGPVSWCDYNNDGLLDLTAFVSNTQDTLTIYRNMGSNTFHAVVSNLLSSIREDMIDWRWGDLDNDGLADLLICAEVVVGTAQTDRFKAYKNAGNGTFSEIWADLPKVGRGDMQLADIDGDGDLDMSILGLEWQSGAQGIPFTPHFQLFRNRAAQDAGLGRANAAPTIPGGLSFVRNAGSSRSKFSWTESTDDHTAKKGLRYETRVGTNTGWSDLADIGERELPGEWGRTSVSTTTPGFLLTTSILGTRPFCWSVRAIDAAGIASDWSAPKWEDLPAAAAGANDVQRDGAVDIADLVETIRMAKGLLTPDFSRADRNGDGKINYTDEAFVASEILGDDAPERDCLALADIGPEGGTMQGDGFQLTVPAAAFNQTTPLRLYKSTVDKPFGADTAAPVFRVRGIPRNTSKPLTLRIKPDKTLNEAENPFGAFGSICDGPSQENSHRSFLARSITIGSDGWATFTIPPIGSAAPSPNASTTPGYQFGVENEEWYTLGSRMFVCIGTYCVVTFPTNLNVSLVDVQAIAEAFDQSWTGFQTTYGLTTTKRTEWPVLIQLYDMGATSNVVAQTNFFRCWDGTLFNGINYRNNGFIECNAQKLGTPDQRKAMAAAVTHESLHLYQDFYDPRIGMMRTKGTPPHHWFYEAQAVWSEPKFLPLIKNIPNPASFTPDAWLSWGDEPFKGLCIAQDGDKSDQQNHGYGLAPLIAYFTDRRGTTSFVQKSLESIEKGDHVVDAICAAGGVTVGAKKQAWWPKFLEQYVNNQIPGYEIQSGLLKGWSDKVFAINDTKVDFNKNGVGLQGEMPDLSGKLITTTLQDKPCPDATVVLSHRLKASSNITLATFLTHGATRTLDGRGASFNGVLKKDVVVAGYFTGQTMDYWMVSGLAINPRSVPPYKGYGEPYTFDVGFTWDRTYTYTSSAQDRSQSPYLPTFTTTYSLHSRGLTDVDHLSISPYGGVIYGSALGETPFDVTFDITSVINNNTATISNSDGSHEEIHVDGVDTYRLDYNDDWIDTAQKSISATDGKFTLTLSKDAHFLGGTVYAVYRRVTDHYKAGESKPSSTSTQNCDWPIGGFSLYPTGIAVADYFKNPTLMNVIVANAQSSLPKANRRSSFELLEMAAAALREKIEKQTETGMSSDHEQTAAAASPQPAMQSGHADMETALQSVSNVVTGTLSKGASGSFDIYVPLSKASNGLNGEIQFDPAMFQSVEAAAGAGANGFAIKTRHIADGKMRFLLYDPNGMGSIDHTKAVLIVTIKTQANIEGNNITATAAFANTAAARLNSSPAGVVSIARGGAGGIPAPEDLNFPTVQILINNGAAARQWKDYY